MKLFLKSVDFFIVFLCTYIEIVFVFFKIKLELLRESIDVLLVVGIDILCLSFSLDGNIVMISWDVIFYFLVIGKRYVIGISLF